MFSFDTYSFRLIFLSTWRPTTKSEYRDNQPEGSIHTTATPPNANNRDRRTFGPTIPPNTRVIALAALTKQMTKFRTVPLPFALYWIVLVAIHSTTVQARTATSTSARTSARLEYRRAFVAKRRHVTEYPSSTINPLFLALRGGSTSTKASPSSEDLEALRAYRWQQQLYLQSRSMQLRQALLARGLDGLHHSPEALEEAKKHVPVDWDCALATDKHPKSCLYSFDAEPGTKVVAPRDTTQWITLTALNRLRRNDPTKVEPLWHSQYSILATWLNPESEYSMYHHLNPAGALLSFLLDSPIVLIGGMMMVLITVFLVTMPFWESLLSTFLASSMLWLQWPNWGRFLHAALPFKLLLGQMAYKFVAFLLGKVYSDLRQRLVELECQMWEECMPLTILEGRMAKAARAERADDDEAFFDASMEISEDYKNDNDGQDDSFMDALEEEDEDGSNSDQEGEEDTDEPEEFSDPNNGGTGSDGDDMNLGNIEDFYAFIDEE